MADEETFALSGDGLYEVTWDGADAPLRAAVLSSGGSFSAKIAEGMLAMANGHPLQGIKKMV